MNHLCKQVAGSSQATTSVRFDHTAQERGHSTRFVVFKSHACLDRGAETKDTRLELLFWI